MKALFYIVLAVFPVLYAPHSVNTVLSSVEDAKSVVRKADEKMRGKTSFALLTIKTVRPSWVRELKIKTWTKGNQYAMIMVTAPARERGTVFLKSGKEVWNWVPSIERVVKLPPSMMSQSWMGTDFSNDDLVKESSIVEDYTHSFSGDTLIEDRSCYKILMVPKPEAAVVWGKIYTWIDKKDYLQMKAEFYNEDGELVSTMNSSEVRRLGGRLLPSKVEMVPADKTGHRTEMQYDSIRFDAPIKDDFFTPQNMKKVK